MVVDSKTEKRVRGLKRIREEIDWYKATLKELDKLPTDETKLWTPLMMAQLEQYDKTVRCVEEGKSLLASYWSICPEVYKAMDIHFFGIQGHHFQQSQARFVMRDLEECDKLGLARDNCSLLRLAMYYVTAGLMPTPTMIIHKLEPCDALLGMHEAVRTHKEWRDIPCYSLDPPYWEDDRTLDYYAGEVRGVVSFLEEQTGKKLDVDRLREVIKESNRQYDLWAEYNELRRAVPCPHGHDLAAQVYPMVQIFWPGDPRCTAWLRDMVADAEERVRTKKGWLSPEKVRVIWFDVYCIWLRDLNAWLEQEWAANIVMDMSSYCPYTLIDTSSEYTMFKGLGKRTICDQIMVRQVRGLADRLLADLQRMIKEYKADAVIPPTHIGHKDQIASLGLIREVCRDAGVACLDMGMVDIFDPRYTSMDEIKDRLNRYLVTMGLG
jgi:benzoyl-CoA reductase/2-hydroxyglutaryl-CoA dehydratase subunit BcrC/BadD/HgdB